MITRIHIKNYKSLVDVEVSLQPLTVILGPNAAGKSNFLDALQLLSRMATSRTLKDAFEPPYRGTPLESFTFGANGVQDTLEKDSATLSFQVDVLLSEELVKRVNQRIQEMRPPPLTDKQTNPITERRLRYTLEIEILTKGGFLRVKNESLQALKKDGTLASRKAFFERQGDKIHLRMEGQSHPRYHDLLLDHTLLSLSHYAPHYPHLTAMREEFESWFFYYFEPRERMRYTTPLREVRHIGPMGEDLAAFLHTLKVQSPLRFQAIKLSLRRIVPTITGIEVAPNRLGEVELRLLEGSTPIPSSLVSEGTLRILGFIALKHSPTPPAVIGFEEPENGVHPRRIEYIAESLLNRQKDSQTQLIVTTHSAVLLDSLPTECLLLCKKREGQTCFQPFSKPLKNLFDGFDDEHKRQIDEGLDETTVSERILRGDFDE